MYESNEGVRFSTYKRQRISKGSLKMDNAEKLIILDTQDEDKQNKNTTKYVLDINIRKQTQTT